MNKSVRIALALILAALTSSICAAEKLGSTFDEIVAAARREGKLIAFTQFPAAASHKAINDAYNQRFGLTTQIEWTPITATTAGTRALSESAGGALGIDLIGFGSFEEVRTLVDAKLLKPYPWTKVFGSTFREMSRLEAMIVPEFRGMALPHTEVAYVLSWNPQSIKDEEVPGRLADFGDPKWKGKIAMNAFSMEPLSILSLGRGEKETIELARRIMDNKPVLGRGSASVNQSIVSGQVLFGTDITLTAQRAVNSKQPLKFKMFSDYIPLTITYMYTPEGAPNPNNARLFIAWLANEGYKIAKTHEVYPSPIDPDSQFRKMADQQVASGAKIMKANSVKDIDQMRRVRTAVNEMLTGNR